MSHEVRTSHIRDLNVSGQKKKCQTYKTVRGKLHANVFFLQIAHILQAYSKGTAIIKPLTFKNRASYI